MKKRDYILLAFVLAVATVQCVLLFKRDTVQSFRASCRSLRDEVFERCAVLDAFVVSQRVEIVEAISRCFTNRQPVAVSSLVGSEKKQSSVDLSLDYHYVVVDGRQYARIGGECYAPGDITPYGRLDDVSRGGLVVEGVFRGRRIKYDSVPVERPARPGGDGKHRAG